MNADTARAEVFGDSLACEETRPAAFLPGALDANAMRVACLQAEGLLRALGVVEDSHIDDTDERTAADLALGRIEAKVDLLTALIASLVNTRERADPLRPLQWSALGACLSAGAEGADAPPPGTTGAFRIQPSDWLPESLQLPATVLATVTDSGGRQTWLRFGPLPAALQTALERHLFRVHRRAIAESRRPR